MSLRYAHVLCVVSGRVGQYASVSPGHVRNIYYNMVHPPSQNLRFTMINYLKMAIYIINQIFKLYWES